MGRRVLLEDEIAAIEALSYPDLTELWRRQYGVAPPKGIRRGLLIRSANWHLQAKRLGGLSRSTKARLRQAIRETFPSDQDRDVDAASDGRARLRKRIEPGSRLIREWNGKIYAVDVTECGFVLDGQPFRSLSAVARHITGARWSGPRFFGL